MSKICEATEIFVPRYLKLQEVYAKHERSHWVPEEADMSVDVVQWKDGTISESGKAYIKMIEDAVEVPNKVISVGPDRKQTILR